VSLIRIDSARASAAVSIENRNEAQPLNSYSARVHSSFEQRLYEYLNLNRLAFFLARPSRGRFPSSSSSGAAKTFERALSLIENRNEAQPLNTYILPIASSRA